MKTIRVRTGKPGYVSYALVLSTGLILSVLTLAAYQRAMNSHSVQSKVVLKADYAEKEDAILRSIVAITPNRAIRAMQHESNRSASSKKPMRWETIFSDALDMANARTSIPTELFDALGNPDLVLANAGDSDLESYSKIFKPYSTGANVTRGMQNDLGDNFPPVLSCDNSNTYKRDDNWPIISHDKYYGTNVQDRVGASVTDYPLYNILTYPQINFGYASPGRPLRGEAKLVGVFHERRGSRRRRDRTRRSVPALCAVDLRNSLSTGDFRLLVHVARRV